MSVSDSPDFASPDLIRSRFASAMSDMYREEVPAYGDLIDLVAHVNKASLSENPEAETLLERSGGLNRLSAERHGAIRVGTAEELSLIRRAFALMGMYPVGYYDLTEAGLPVHSTAFRPLDEVSLARNPFRIFTSLLRLDLITDKALREAAKHALSNRQIFSDDAVRMIEGAEAAGGVRLEDLGHFISAVLETFRWREEANVSLELYDRLLKSHRLIADIVCFKGPHINHLTPRTLDIETVQKLMPERGMDPKAIIEGPPSRKCPILLRQTSFKALSEAVQFPKGDGSYKSARHTARFGEIEQRGVALTPKGRALYDECLAEVLATTPPAPDGSNTADYIDTLNAVFARFPDDWETLRRKGYAYFRYDVVAEPAAPNSMNPDELIESGALRTSPIIYEDFLPVSAAGIFRSNLGDDRAEEFAASRQQTAFEADLGAPVIDPFDFYARIEKASLEACLQQLQNPQSV